MHVISQIAAILAGLVHIFIFYLEAVAFSKPSTYRRFMITDEKEAGTIAPWAFNQGFYNLFLAIGTIAGSIIWMTGRIHSGRSLVGFGCACMLAAALVLIGTDRRMTRAAVMQGLFPLVALATLW